MTDTSESMVRGIPCGRCNCGTYAVGAVLAGIEQYRGARSLKEALKATPRCKTNPRHICFWDRDFAVAVEYPFTRERCDALRAEVNK